MMMLTYSFEMMLGAANGMCVEFSAVAFVGCRSRCGFRRSGLDFYYRSWGVVSCPLYVGAGIGA